MAMHYPPLANGAYRVGDPPQPFPPSRPGPEQSARLAPGGLYWDGMPRPAQPPQFAFQQQAAHHPAPPVQPAPLAPRQFAPPPQPMPSPAPMPPQQPPLEPPDPGQRPKRGLIAVGATAGVVAASALVFALVPGGQFSSVETFDSEGTLTISAPVILGGTSECILPPGLEDVTSSQVTVQTGDPLSQVAEAPIQYQDGTLGECTFTFSLDDVPTGQPTYLVSLQGHGELDYTEQEMRDGVDIIIER